MLRSDNTVNHTFIQPHAPLHTRLSQLKPTAPSSPSARQTSPSATAQPPTPSPRHPLASPDHPPQIPSCVIISRLYTSLAVPALQPAYAVVSIPQKPPISLPSERRSEWGLHACSHNPAISSSHTTPTTSADKHRERGNGGNVRERRIGRTIPDHQSIGLRRSGRRGTLRSGGFRLPGVSRMSDERGCEGWVETYDLGRPFLGIFLHCLLLLVADDVLIPGHSGTSTRTKVTIGSVPPSQISETAETPRGCIRSNAFSNSRACQGFPSIPLASL
jgi:hypothetical protein